jgi:hypothetical protein
MHPSSTAGETHVPDSSVLLAQDKQPNTRVPSGCTFTLDATWNDGPYCKPTARKDAYMNALSTDWQHCDLTISGDMDAELVPSDMLNGISMS